MHPIERLRAVARIGWAEPDTLAAEAAWALADLALSDPVALVPACRRLLERHPGCGPLWWVAARVLTAGDPVLEAERCGDELAADPTPAVLAAALPDGVRAVRRGGVGEVAAADVVVVVTDAIGPGGMVVDAGDEGIVLVARQLEVPVWVEAGVGRILPARLWEAMRACAASVAHSGGPVAAINSPYGAHYAQSVTFQPLDGVTMLVGPRGALEPVVALAGTDCPEPAELLSHW